VGTFRNLFLEGTGEKETRGHEKLNYNAPNSNLTKGGKESTKERGRSGGGEKGDRGGGAPKKRPKKTTGKGPHRGCLLPCHHHNGKRGPNAWGERPDNEKKDYEWAGPSTNGLGDINLK